MDSKVQAQRVGSRGRPLQKAIQDKARKLVASVGELEACRRIRCSRNALIRGLANLPVLEGTHALFLVALTPDSSNSEDAA
jgi:hypothetical protein